MRSSPSVLAVAAVAVVLAVAASTCTAARSPIDYVDPYIGTGVKRKKKERRAETAGRKRGQREGGEIESV